MIRPARRFASLALAATAALVGSLGVSCTPPENTAAFIEGILPISPDNECLVDGGGNVFTPGALLDIGFGANEANALVIAPRVVTNLPNTFAAADISEGKTKSPNYPNYGHADNNTINFTAAEMYFTTDADRDGASALTTENMPVNTNTARRVGLGGTLYNTQSQLNQGAAVIATAITTDDAALLQSDPYIQEAIGTSGRAKILLNLRVLGTTTGGASVRTPAFVFPVELCQGCLVTDVGECASGAVVDTGCVRGVDYPTVCL